MVYVLGFRVHGSGLRVRGLRATRFQKEICPSFDPEATGYVLDIRGEGGGVTSPVHIEEKEQIPDRRCSMKPF